MSEVFYTDDALTLLCGDAFDVARKLESGSVQCIVTSPPYFGLRDYGEDQQLGSEVTLDAYVDRLVSIFRELRRVLAEDGTLWLNLGDTYASKARTSAASDPKNPVREHHRSIRDLPAKNLLGVPWRVAFALQADGWILRSEVIWQKPNAMPESVVDRPSREHEHVFLLVKAPEYFYNADAVRVQYEGDRAASRRARSGKVNKENSIPGPYVPDEERGRNLRDVWSIPTVPFAGAHFAAFPPALVRPCVLAGTEPGDVVLDPFSGSGTTGAVATQEGRRYIGVDLNRSYLELSLRARFAQPTLAIGA